MQENAAGKITSFYRRHKRMPSYREIAELCGYASKNAAYKLVNQLIEAGVLERDATGKLVPRSLTDTGAKLLGLVEAGFPSPAEEELLDTLSLDDYLIENKEGTFILRVKGDSMIDAGIQEGDMVIVDRSKTARAGDIVIAEVDGAWTMKYLRKRERRVWLEPANAAYDIIEPQEELKIAAVVTAVIRKY
jgi:repressor LexA